MHGLQYQVQGHYRLRAPSEAFNTITNSASLTCSFTASTPHRDPTAGFPTIDNPDTRHPTALQRTPSKRMSLPLSKHTQHRLCLYLLNIRHPCKHHHPKAAMSSVLLTIFHSPLATHNRPRDTSFSSPASAAHAWDYWENMATLRGMVVSMG